MKYIKENNYLETNDIALTAVLCYFGGQIEDIDKSNQLRARFFIKRSPDLDKVVRDYWSHSLKVEPSSFLNILKEVKTRLYQQVK